MALLELNSELKSLRRRLELKDERPWPLRSCLFIPALTARLIARQPALHDAVKHLNHFLFHRLPRNLQQERLGKNSILDALLLQTASGLSAEYFRSARFRASRRRRRSFQCTAVRAAPPHATRGSAVPRK